MNDFDEFERRLAAAVRSDADLSVAGFEPGLIASVAIGGVQRRASRPARRFARGRGTTLLAAAALLLVGGAVAAGSGLVRLPSLVPPLPLPSLAVVASPSPAEESASPAISPSPAPSETPVPIPPRAPSWAATGSMIGDQAFGRATLLPDGKVLMTGGFVRSLAPTGPGLATLYDPSSGTWIATANMIEGRQDHTATRLPDGKVLVAGGFGVTAELYDPSSGSWAATGSMTTGRAGHTATLLPDGRVLVAGGRNGDWRSMASAELYDPASGTWAATGSMIMPRQDHKAVLLPDGRVLVMGGVSKLNSEVVASAELYDPASGTWTSTASMSTPRTAFTATVLPDGRVLVAGGIKNMTDKNGSAVDLASVELYDPASGTWTRTASMVTPRVGHSATLLPDGTVLVAGGYRSALNWNNELVTSADSAELYDPASGTWTRTASMVTPRADHSAALLPDGSVLVAGGFGVAAIGSLTTAELYDPGSGQ